VFQGQTVKVRLGATPTAAVVLKLVGFAGGEVVEDAKKCQVSITARKPSMKNKGNMKDVLCLDMPAFMDLIRSQQTLLVL
jgi:hypothetical protein